LYAHDLDTQKLTYYNSVQFLRIKSYKRLPQRASKIWLMRNLTLKPKLIKSNVVNQTIKSKHNKPKRISKKIKVLR
jgi:hypothetical protein